MRRLGDPLSQHRSLFRRSFAGRVRSALEQTVVKVDTRPVTPSFATGRSGNLGTNLASNSSKGRMTYIDSAVLNVTEWLCRRFQLLTGRTNVWLAFQLTNLSIIVYFVWAGFYFWLSDRGMRVAVVLFCSGLMYVLSQTIFKDSIEAYESSAYQRVAKGYRNPRRVRDALLRIPFLTLSIVLFYPILFIYLNLRDALDLPVRIVVLSYSLIILTTTVLYVLACDPLPPCTGKVKEWLKAALPSRLAVPESRNLISRLRPLPLLAPSAGVRSRPTSRPAPRHARP